MKLKLSLALTALALASQAQANLIFPTTGSGSVAFVAQDGAIRGPNVAATQSLVLDLGFTMLDFMPEISGYTVAAGQLTAPGTVVVWDFANNTRTVNGVASSGDFAYSTPYNSFYSTATNGTAWGVISADNVSGAPSATTAANFGTMGTGNSTAAEMATLIGSGGPGQAAANVSNFFAANNFNGTLVNQPNSYGGNVATSGNAFMGNNLARNGTSDFNAGGGYVNMQFLTMGTSNFIQFTRQQSNSLVYQLGLTVGVDTPATDPASFTFDATAGTLTYIMPVPEPGQYAMLLAGLAAIGFVVRRRQRNV
jgi:hypothetical protein